MRRRSRARSVGRAAVAERFSLSGRGGRGNARIAAATAVAMALAAALAPLILPQIVGLIFGLPQPARAWPRAHREPRPRRRRVRPGRPSSGRTRRRNEIARRAWVIGCATNIVLLALPLENEAKVAVAFAGAELVAALAMAAGGPLARRRFLVGRRG